MQFLVTNKILGYLKEFKVFEKEFEVFLARGIRFFEEEGKEFKIFGRISGFF